MEGLWADVRLGVRTLRRSPVTTVAAAATLALAIGANTAIFSVIYGAMLRPLPFPRPERLFQVVRQFQAGYSTSQSVPKFVRWREEARSFERIAAFENLGSGFNLTGESRPERVTGSRVTRDFLTVLGVQPVLGRDFTASEDRPGAPKVVVIGNGLWHRRFGGDRTVLGRVAHLNGEPYTVIGVMPPGFQFPRDVELWTPLQANESAHEVANYLDVIGRLAPRATADGATAELGRFADRYREEFPDEMSEGETFRARPVLDVLHGALRPALLMLLGAVGFVLLIACVNVANLQFARASARRREIALRTILGAKAGRLVRQLLTESALLALAGGAAGLTLAQGILELLMTLGPESVQRIPVAIDATVLGFTLIVSLATGLLFGLVPALHASRPNLAEAVNESGARATRGAGGSSTHRLLVVLEVALALVLLVGASLLLRSFAGLRGVDPGFRSERVLTMKLSLPEAKYADPAALERFARQVVERVDALPGVASSALATTLPMQGGPDLPFTIEGRYVPGTGEGAGGAYYRPVTAGFFAVLDIPVVRGRGFTEGDHAGAPLVALVNEVAARRFWPDGDPIGERIWLGQPIAPELADPGPREIVAVIRDVREDGLEQEAPAIIYVPLGQISPAIAPILIRLLPQNLLVRAGVDDAASLAPAVQREIWAVDADQPVTTVLLMDEVVERTIGSHQFNLLLIGALAVVALALAAVGLYGVLSYLVQQRTREIGVRMALGATTGGVLSLVLRQGLSTVGLGIALGLGGAFALTRALGSLVSGVSPRDPLAFTVAPAVLLVVALAAIWLPARRAAAVDPLAALRAE